MMVAWTFQSDGGHGEKHKNLRYDLEVKRDRRADEVYMCEG